MIGMSQIRKRLIYGILIGAGIGVIGIVITLVWSMSVVNSYKAGTNKEYIENHTKEVTMLNKDVIQGETITEDMLMTVRVHEKAVPDGLANYPVDRIAKYNIPANIPLVNSMFGTEIVTIDERIQDVSVVNLPTDLMEGDYIDIKIKMPSGLEYVVVPQIKVRQVMGNTIRLYLNEEDLYYLNSATVDTYLNDGVVLYGVKYVDPITQIKIDDVIEDEDGNKISISDQAKRDLIEKIESDVQAGTFTLTIPDEVVTQPDLTDGAEKTDDDTKKQESNIEEKENTTSEEKVEPTQEYINFTNNLADLLLKYAVEYRYYVESYNKVSRTYEPSDMIREHMMKNEYITEKAKETLKKNLEAGVRRSIEENLARFQSDSGDKFENVVSGIEEQIAAQQALRNATLAGQ